MKKFSLLFVSLLIIFSAFAFSACNDGGNSDFTPDDTTQNPSPDPTPNPNPSNPDSNPSPDPTPNPKPTKYNIIFNVDGKNFASVETAGNETVELPQVPVKNDLFFDGWFLDDVTFENQFKQDQYLDSAPNGDINVYAKWLTRTFNLDPKDSSRVLELTALGRTMTEIEIYPQINGVSITKIGRGAFLAATVAEKIVLPEGIEKIENQAFSSCKALKTINIPKSVTEIGNAAFYNCGTLQSIDLPSSVNAISDETFYRCENLNTVIAPNIVSIGKDAFKYCKSLVRYEAPRSVTSIGNYAFYGCEKLEYFKAVNLLTLGDYALSECAALKDVQLPSTITSIGRYAFYNNPVMKEFTYTLPALIEIGEYAFSKCTAFDSFDVSAKLQKMGDYAFSESGISYIRMTRDILYPGIGVYKNCANLTILAINEGVTKMPESYFSGCINLPQIKLPPTLDSIDSYAFANCDRLTEIEIPTGLTEISPYSFSYCDELATVTLPSSIVKIGEGAFKESQHLKNIGLPDNLTSIGAQAFYNCLLMPQSSLPLQIESIGDKAFYNCQFITYMNLESLDKLKTIGISAFEKTRINSLLLSKNLEFLGARAFAQTPILTAYFGTADTYDCKVAEIPDSAFEECANLEFVYLSSNLTKIGNRAFYKCEKLKSVTINQSKNYFDSIVSKGTEWDALTGNYTVSFNK